MARFEGVEENKVKIFFEVDKARFEEGIQFAYNKNKKDIAVPGFRKGRVPRKIIEMNYGKEIFYDDAVNHVLPDAYSAAVTELDLQVVSRPEIDIEEISTDDGVKFTAVVFIKPEVKAKDYMGLTYKPESTEVAEEDIQKEVDAAREKNARVMSVSDRPIQDGDTAVIDFEGFMDGEAFEGGKGTDFELVIGSHSFIDTFEDQLIGHNVGDDVEVNVTFPENYGRDELSGKPALFKVEIKDIKTKELPEADDEFAQDISEFDTLEEYKKDIEAKLKEEKENAAEIARENQIMDQIIEKAEMNVPEVMFENEIDQLVENFGRRFAYQGLTLEMYLQYSGQSMADLRNMYRGDAEKKVKGRLALEAIAAQENIEISQEEIEEEIQKMAESSKMEVEQLRAYIQAEEMENLKDDLKVRAALKIVVDSAVAAAE